MLLPTPFQLPWPIHEAVQLAILLEVSAPKVGNVHPEADFDDMHFGHFLFSATALHEVFCRCSNMAVGQLVLNSVRATRKAVGCNTNLGTLLLFAPLAKAAGMNNELPLRDRVHQVLKMLSAQDAELVYQAIRTAKPGGMGCRPQDDIVGPAPPSLIAAMAAVADVDAVARQYTNDFADVLEKVVPWLEFELSHGMSTADAICRVQLRLLADQPDGLIVRKLGVEQGREVQQRALAILPEICQHSGAIVELESIQQLDRYLRADGHRRNPGTTADLIAASLLVLLILE